MATKADLAKFTALRLQAYALLCEASLLDVPAHCRAQAKAAAGLAGLELHRPCEPVDRSDADKLADDCRAIARNVDPLIAAIGDEAASCFGFSDKSDFADQLLGALDGNATYVIEEAGREHEASQRHVVEDRFYDLMRESA